MDDREDFIKEKEGRKVLMYSYIRGKLIEKNPIFVVLEASGIGYKLFVPISLLNKLPSLEEEVCLFTSFIVRELSQTLYGFFAKRERDLFEVLINVSGIGPKTALAMIGTLSSIELQQAIQMEDIATICKVPGIGKRSAERLIVELKDKLENVFGASQESVSSIRSIDLEKDEGPLASMYLVKDALNALVNLGYGQPVAEKSIKSVIQANKGEIDLPSLISLALKNL